MSLPGVDIEELDGAIGVLPAGQRLLAIVGVSTSGPLNLPAAFARKEDVISNFGAGPLVEKAAYAIVSQGRPVVVVRTGNTTPGTASAVTSVKAGTSVVTVKASPTPIDDLEVVLKIIAGGTIEAADPAITFRLSFDAGRNYGPLVSLGIAEEYEVEDAGFTFAFGAGTVVAGDTFKVVTVAPNFSAAELGTALDALRNTAIDWEACDPAGPLDGDRIGQLETKFGALHAAGKYCYWLGYARMKTTAESDAAYQASISTALAASRLSIHGGLTGGDTKFVSQVTGNVNRRPLAFSVGPLQASVSEEINIADVNIGALLGVSIRDSNGNPDEHDESINPGLDDAGFITARSVEDYGGVYVTRPRLFSPDTSDFQLIPHRRVMNLAHRALRRYFVRRLANPVLVDRVTGFILEREALEIEAGAVAAMRGLIMAKPKASDVGFVLGRSDNLLATKTLTGAGTITPLGYPEFFNLTLSFKNPASSPVIALAA